MTRQLCVGWMRLGVLGAALLGTVACTPSDYSDGINGFSQAVAAAANLGQPLEAAAQQADQNGLTATKLLDGIIALIPK